VRRPGKRNDPHTVGRAPLHTHTYTHTRIQMYITMYAYTHIYTQVTSERVDQAKGILTRTLTLLSVRPSRTVAGIISQKMALPLIYSKFSCKLIFGRNRTDAVSGDAEAQRKAALDDMQASRCRYHITHCNTLLRIATHCNTLQHTATHCNTPNTATSLCSLVSP